MKIGSPITNSARARLEAGELSLGVALRSARTVEIAPIMQTAGMDWLFIDCEHGATNLETAAQICVAGLGYGIATLIRVSHGDFFTAARLLDSGALGIVMPHVESADEARAMVARLRFPPVGHRGVSGTLPHFAFQRGDLGAAVAEINRSVLLAVMLETREAVDRADEIAAVEGIDVVMIGTNDLAMALGTPGKMDTPEIDAAYAKVAAAAKANGKWLGCGGIADADHLQRYIHLGVRLILAGQDVGFLIQGARNRVETLRQLSLRAAPKPLKMEAR